MRLDELHLWYLADPAQPRYVGALFLPPGRLLAETPRAVDAVDDAQPDRWGESPAQVVHSATTP